MCQKREFKRLYLKKRNVQSESLVFIQNNNLVSNLWTWNFCSRYD
ncbi:hypothetical protein LEP1GSC104_1095 [Leptospira interrogans str. UI 12621]|uniref:Uncharacterized protein n=2 Tax=Leptospira interrogans TaxID=173 RepID=A0A0E2D4T6_LEPIR|nr:hypothetical protein LEP1GSC104_1095 [Leptospira interrogans str. UI 12621]EKO97356.1 hypothetical protein LEP1GSC057_3963 [Leptospira interrogans str. Brem 329]EKR55006.1 hypothetical protein LEP1GSC105_3821 [Leptospira interrogans str. UI 12758]